MHVPDSIDPIIGWRIWTYGELLGSWNKAVPICPGEPQVGCCYALRAHEVPDAECTCGIYAVRSLTELQRTVSELVHPYQTESIAFGRVSLWGKVVEHQSGYRAEFSYPKTILAESTAATERLATLYGIEVETSCTWEKCFAFTELSLWGFRSRHLNLNPAPLYPVPGPTVIWIDEAPKTPSMPKSSRPPRPNRSVPVQLRAMVAQKEENAKSKFWDRI